MSLQPEQPARGIAEHPSTIGKYSPEERVMLLKLAHDSIAAALEEGNLSLIAPTQHLAEPRAAFTTLYCRGRLRGCVGHVIAVDSVWVTVAETAKAAAFEDIRFNPVTIEELPHLKVSLSLLSPLELIHADEVEVGKHGLLVSFHGRRGLLLPQVPVEHGWDRITFLQETCHKAGLSKDAWKQGATLEAFSAEAFGDASSER